MSRMAASAALSSTNSRPGPSHSGLAGAMTVRSPGTSSNLAKTAR
jgi:hypothetical protein